MTEPVMKYGARKGRMSAARRWLAKALTQPLRIFPVPGADIFRLYDTNDSDAFRLAENPREADVLLVMGELPETLAEKAAVAYAQIPRPRVLVFAGPEELFPLPKPDIHVALNEQFLKQALPVIRELFRNHAWSENAEPWTPKFLEAIVADQDDDKGEHNHHHNHGEDENSDDRDEENEQRDEHDSHDHRDEQDQENHNHSDDGDTHDGMDRDFMSMVMMTKDLPRPKDGLPMNRSEVHFGPFHPGLPGGLCVYCTMDGDTVAEAHVEHGLLSRDFDLNLSLKADELPGFLENIKPLSPQCYRLLGRKVLQAVSGEGDDFTSGDVQLMEKERIGSHLNWLATFGNTIGNKWLHGEAAKWFTINRKDHIEQTDFRRFLSRIRKMPYLKKKLLEGKAIPEALLHHVSGPVAKAAGKEQDARASEEMYHKLGWEPVIKQENNPWGRLLVRLLEMEQSLELIRKVEEGPKKPGKFDTPQNGEATARIESPRGTLSLNVKIEDEYITDCTLETPSKVLAGLVDTVAKEAELSDALVSIASLDISPWEMELNVNMRRL